MEKIVIICVICFLLQFWYFYSCTTNEKSDIVVEKGPPERSELSKDSKIFYGNRLFSEKTCVTCHAKDRKKIGPSIVDIMQVYKENNASIEAFLRGNSKPIVDTTKSQVAIMQANIDGFLKKSNRRRVKCYFYIYDACR